MNISKYLKSCMVVVVACLTNISVGAESGRSWVMMNPTGRLYSNELVRLKVDLPSDFDSATWTVTEDGRVVPCQAEMIGGKTAVWVLTNLGRGENHTYSIEKRNSAKSQGKVSVQRKSDAWVLDNGLTAIQIPAQAEPGVIPPPVMGVRLPGDRWVGKGYWKTDRKLVSFESKVIGDGTLFGKIRLDYRFEGVSGLDKVPAFCRIDISLAPDRNHVVIEETFEMSRESCWVFDSAAGWEARNAFAIPHFGGFDREDMKDPEGKPYPFPPRSLKTGQTRMGDTLLNLVPRWSQAFDDGWFFLTHDGENGVGAMVCRAGKWLWPYDGMIEIKVKPSADYAGFQCPTWRGKRFWLLLAGPYKTWANKETCEEYVLRHSFETLDKLHQEYILDWPGLEPPAAKDGKPAITSEEYGSGAGRFGRRSKPFFGWGPGSGNISGGDHPVTALIRAQVYLDPDTFGDYWHYYSPENPNFATTWWAPLFREVAKCKGHPQFDKLVEMAKMKLREDLYHSVTLPGGAGQECPGYQAGALDHLYGTARFCRDNLGFDLTEDERFKADASFFLHTSHPMGDGSRRSHPAGDTHPPGPDVFAKAKTRGLTVDIASFVTEELPGFGVVFRNRPATSMETYFAFKSGPNRGHFHGDQLSFHYGAFGRMQLVDHHCSYKPRAGQEHMHNRVAFHTENMPWANMDGYERVIACKTSAGVDVGMGQVESERLRCAEKFPPEKWDARLPELIFDVPLKYRRTVVFMKGKDRDYFVIRDQSVGPDVYATYCLHGYGDKIDQKDNTFDFDGVRLFVAKPGEFQVSRHDWQHANGDPEMTKGLRLTTKGRSSEFVTVIVPKLVPARSVLRFTMTDALVRGDGAKSALVLILDQENGKISGVNPVFTAPDFNMGGRTGAVNIATDSDGVRLKVKVDVGDDRWMTGGTGDYAVTLTGKEGAWKGSFSGTLNLRQYKGKNDGFKKVTGLVEVKGAVAGELVKDWYPVKVEYKSELPAMTSIPGGVKVGEDEIVFGGGVDNEDATQYVSIRRGGKEVLSLTGREIDMDRSQGEIGLFVPDAGYPFGVLPDWLLRQRSNKPDWYRDVWPPAGRQK